MKTIDEHFVPAPAKHCFHVAADVERWPDILPHYRYVRFREKYGLGRGRVEMAAWRDFVGPIRYPTRWVSEMTADANEPNIRYTHVGGVTRGMDVEWQFYPRVGGTLVRIVHLWNGPDWPLIGGFAADHIIGPWFVSAIAARTLAGVGDVAADRTRKTQTTSVKHA